MTSFRIDSFVISRQYDDQVSDCYDIPAVLRGLMCPFYLWESLYTWMSDYMSFLVGVISSLSASFILLIVQQIILARRGLMGEDLSNLVGDWNLYRYAVRKTTDQILRLDISVKKKRFWRGFYFDFRTRYVHGGICRGVIKIRGRIVTCIFMGNVKNEPFIISFYNHSIKEVGDFKVGIMSGVASVNNMPYAAKVLMSRTEIPAEDVSTIINKTSTIRLQDDLSPVLNIQSKVDSKLNE